MALLIVFIIVWVFAKNSIALHFANGYLKDKNVTIEAIAGDWLSSIKIKKIQHNDKIVVDEIACHYNLWRLLNRRVDIESCEIKNFDINQTMIVAQAFKSEDNSSEPKTQSSPIQWKINAKKLKLNATYGLYAINIEASLVENFVDSIIKLNTPYLNTVYLASQVDIDKMHYNGELKVDENDTKSYAYSEMIKDMVVTFKGDMNQTYVDIDSKYLTGSFVSQEFNHSIITLYTKKPMPLKGVVPKELEALKVGFVTTTSLYLQGIEPIHAYLNIDSNLVNLHLDNSYDEQMRFIGNMEFPKESLLHNFDNNLHLNKLGKIALDATIENNQSINLALNAKRIGAKVHYDNKNINAALNIASQKLKLDGNIDQMLTLDLELSSIKQLLKTIQPIYSELPKLRGELFGKAIMKQQKSVDVTLQSKYITINKEKISNIALHATSDLKSVTILNYSLNIDQFKLYATKEARVKWNKSMINLEQFWINDDAQIKGVYDSKNAKGEFAITSKALRIYYPKYIDTKLISDLKIKLSQGDTDISGLAQLNGGKIFFKPDNSQNFALDKDIIIQKKSPQSSSKLSINVALLTPKPLIYKAKDADIQANLYLQVTQEPKKPLKLYGMIAFNDWTSYYILQNKKIRLYKSSAIHFIGDPTRPNLDIKAHYKGLGAKIEIIVVGDPSTPVLNFNSTPTMTKEQILSLLLLDTPAGGNVNQKEQLEYLLGGALAKSLLSNIGLRVDHFVISSDKFEIGRKIGDKITVIYLGDTVSSVKVIYQHSPNIEADFIINKESSSMDIFYTGEL